MTTVRVEQRPALPTGEFSREPISGIEWFTVDTLLKVERFAEMLPYEMAEIAWSYERKAYMLGEIEIEGHPDFTFCEDYEALKASRYYEAAERLKK